MKYWKIEMGNGYCGCDEEFVTKTEDSDLTFEDCLDMYAYSEGAAGIDPSDEEFEEYSYVEYISDNTTWEEITEEEYRALIDKEGWGER